MPHFQAGPLDVNDARAWAAWFPKALSDLVRRMEERQQLDTMSLDGFLTLSDRLCTSIHDQAVTQSGQGRREFTATVPMTAQEFRMLDTMGVLLQNYAEILDLRGIPFQMPPEAAARVIIAFINTAKLVD